MTEKLLVPDIGDFENVEVIELLVKEGQEKKKGARYRKNMLKDLSIIFR